MPETEPVTSVRVAAAFPPCAALERALNEFSNVVGAKVVIRGAPARAEAVAYVVSTGPFSADKAREHLAQLFPAADLPEYYVRVTRLPLTASGEVDEARLLALPVVEPRHAEELEVRLAALPQVDHAAAFVQEVHEAPRVLHVTELLPTIGTGRAAPSAAAAATPARTDEANAPALDGASAQPALERPLAVCVGAELGTGANALLTLPAVLEHAAKAERGGITYLQHDGTTSEQSLSELLTEAERICAGLQSAGFVQGQKIVFQLARADDVLPAFWACLLGGFVPVISAIPPSYTAPTNELERLCQTCQLLGLPPLVTTQAARSELEPLLQRLGLDTDKALSIAELRASKADMVRPTIAPDDVAFLSLTSGSTGTPKAIMLSHRNILIRARGTNILARHEPTDRILNWLPFDHIGSISDWHLRCIDLGCEMIYSSKEYVLGEPLNWLRLIDRFRITHSWAPNFAYALINDALNHATEHWDLSSMKSLLTAGEAVSSNTVHEFLRRLAPHGLARTALRPAFGMAELGSGVTYFQPTDECPVRVRYVDRARLDGPLESAEPGSPDAIGFTSLGPVIPGASMRIVDDKNTPLPEFTVGRLQIAGGPVCLGYFENPAANSEVFVGDGWFNTGDRGFIVDGELYLTGRDKESLIINGANYYNGEIEACVEQVPGVHVSFCAACAVRPAGVNEERLAVFFSPVDPSPKHLGRLLREVQNSVAKKTGVKPDFLLPVAREVIPKTGIGKIQRKQLTKRFEAGEFEGSIRESDVLLENEHTVPEWFLEPVWRPNALRTLAGTATERSYLVIEDGHGLAAEIVQELARAGARVERASPEAYRRLVAPGGGFSHVLDCRDYAPASNSAPATSEALAARTIALLEAVAHAAGDVAARPAGHRGLDYVVVASQAQAVSAGEALDPARAIIPALLKALSQELPSVSCRHLDFEFAGEPAALQRQARAIAAELDALNRADEVAYRAGTRLLPELERIQWSAAGSSASALQSGGLYVLTGGLGGVGSELARYLLQNFAATLVIVGRRPVNAAAADGPGAILHELAELGAVRYVALDVTNAGELERAVKNVELELGRGVTGVFHLASSYHEGLLSQETASSLAEIFKAKYDGARAVGELVAARPEAFVVQFSSLASVFSGSGIGAYAAANRALDALSHEERRAGRRSYAVNWSVWKGLGIGAASAPIEILESKGYHALAPLKGFWSLAAILRREPGRLLAGVEPTNANIQPHLTGASAPLVKVRCAFAARENGESLAAVTAELERITVQDRFGNALPLEFVALPQVPLGADGLPDREAILRELRGATHEHVPPETVLQEQLVELWKNVLGVEALGIDDSFFELGGTSLLSVRLFAEIERQFGASLPPATLFRAATVRALAELLEAEHTPHALDSLVLLAPGEGHVGLFFVHDPEGDVSCYEELAHKLVPKLPIYGITPHQRDNFPALHTRIEDMVTHYVDRIQSVQPAGPYLLAGAAGGGVIAFEMACRLRAQGHAIALLALLDTIAPVAGTRGLRVAERLRSLLPASGAGGLSSMLRRGLEGLGMAGVNYARVRLLQRFTDREQAPPWFLEHIAPRVVYDFAEARHRASKLDGRVTLLRAQGPSLEQPGDTPSRSRCSDPELGWRALALAGVTVIDVPGGHLSMLHEPHVALLADELSRQLARGLEQLEVKAAAE